MKNLVRKFKAQLRSLTNITLITSKTQTKWKMKIAEFH